MSLYAFDEKILAGGFEPLCGVDEAGRGPLAGPVYAAAVILPPEEIPGLNDSKKLSGKKREELYDVITERAAAFCVASADVEEIEALNILQASLLAMRRAVAGLGVTPGCVLVDGNQDPGFGDLHTLTVVKGDAASASIAAASILAKVARDHHMQLLDALYPQYQFARHKGYPTALHYEMLEVHGVCPAHRRSFLRKWMAAK